MEKLDEPHHVINGQSVSEYAKENNLRYWQAYYRLIRKQRKEKKRKQKPHGRFNESVFNELLGIPKKK